MSKNNTLSKKRKASKTKPAKAKRTPESTFYEALERLKRIGTQNDSAKVKLDELVARVTPQIEPYELEKYHAIKEFTLKLIPFLSKKTLAEYMREELHEWIGKNMEKLACNPFYEKIDLTPVDNLLHEHIHKLHANESEKLLKRLAKQGHSQEELAEAEELVNSLKNADSLEEFLEQTAKQFKDNGMDHDDLFDDELFDFDTDDPSSDGGSNTDNFDDDFFQNDFDDWLETEQAAQDAEISRLIKATSINKLFRKIARALHPDLEQDEDKKLEKHDKMARLLEAREQKDIAYILQLYTDTFGQLPDDFPQKDFTKLTKVINVKIEQAKQDKDDILYSTPFHGLYHEWFSATTKQKEALNIQSFIKGVKQDRQMYEDQANDITSIAKLKAYLETRMRSNMYGFDEY